MRGTILAASLAVLLTVSSVGCKSMPSLAWWQSASNPEATEETAVAHTAPALPSDVAIQTEGLATTKETTTNPVSASPYVSTGAPGVSPAAYPSTGAPSFSPSASSTTAAAAAPAENGSNLGSIAMPYNPNVAPPANQTARPISM